MEVFLHNKISEEQTLWWNLYSVTASSVSKSTHFMEESQTY